MSKRYHNKRLNRIARHIIRSAERDLKQPVEAITDLLADNTQWSLSTILKVRRRINR